MLFKDDWLSEYFPGGAYRYTKPFDEYELSNGFVYAKVSADDMQSTNELMLRGFNLIEVLLNFVQKQSSFSQELDLNNCRFVSPDDKQQILDIAKNAFVFSRLYRDAQITQNIANQIKHDWVENYFYSKRGTSMVVCHENKNICGFALLINNVIDLIAVSPNFLRRGVASNMIAFANNEIGLLSAGTQLINKPSIEMYQKAGFYLQDAALVFHKHQ